MTSTAITKRSGSRPRKPSRRRATLIGFPSSGPRGLAAWQASKLYQSMGGDWQPGQAGMTLGQRDPRLERPGVLRINTGEFDPAGRPMGRMGTPADIGNVVALVCSPDSSWITGQLIHADRGASLVDTLLPLEMQRG
jgi:hypothetical protein